MEEFNQENILRAGYTTAFPLAPYDSLVHLKEELGLSVSPHRLALLQNKLWKQSNRYTFDEIYAVDAYIRESQTYYADIRIGSAEIENAQAGEAFADIIKKYTALGCKGAPSFDSLPSVYNAYLDALNFAPSKSNVSVVPISTLPDTRGLLSGKPTKLISRAPRSSFALAQTAGNYRFNTNKEKISNYKKAVSSIKIIYVELPQEDFAWMSLCEKIDRSFHMSADVLLAIPVGNGGIWHALNGCGCSYLLDNASLSTFFEKEIRPKDLTESSSALMLFTCTDTLSPMLNALQRWGYHAADIGSVTTQDDYLSISYGGIVHTVSYGAIAPALTPKALSLHIPANAESEKADAALNKENDVFCLSFDTLGFNALSSRLEEMMATLTEEKEDVKLSLAFALPIDVSEGAEHDSIENRFSEFLAIYRSCAMRAIPMVSYMFPRTDKKENATVWVWDEATDFKV